jgi:hypothetical protein
MTRNPDDILSFKLTFNLPAKNKYFDEDQMLGIAISFKDGVPQFRAALPNADPEGDIFTVQARPRGGYQTFVTGELAASLYAYLTEKATVARPFFVMKKMDGGWATVQHFDRDGAPPKFEPHMRLWFEKERSELGVRPPINDEIAEQLGAFATMMRAARDVVALYDAERRIGRPPAEVMESRQVLDAFAALSQEIIPTTAVGDSLNNFEQVNDLLSTAARVMSETMRKVKTTPSPSTVSAAA